jgi:hypothetical protein
MKPFKELTESQNKELLKLPCFISLLAANNDNKLDAKERQAIIKFSHIKTYSCNPLLFSFYRESDKYFENNMMRIYKDLPLEKLAREAAINKELFILENLVLKLEEEYVSAIHSSMNSFKEHVLRAHHNILADFIFPIPIKGLSY